MAAANTAARNEMLRGMTTAELEAEMEELVSSDIIKDFRKTAGADHFSGEAGGEAGESLTEYINWKIRLKGALRRANKSYKFLFSHSKNCDISVIHCNNMPGSGMSEALYDVLSMVTSDTALGIIRNHENTLDGGAALQELDKVYITGSYKERSEIKTAILVTDFGKDDPRKKLQSLSKLMEMRAL